MINIYFRLNQSKEKQKLEDTLHETYVKRENKNVKAMKTEMKCIQSAVIKPVSISCHICKRQFFRKGNFSSKHCLGLIHV